MGKTLKEPMDLRIKYLTTNVEDIMEDMLKYQTNNEKINFLWDTKSYLATIATKLEREIISPLTHYEELFKMLPEKNEGADIILRALCSSVRTIAEDRKKVGFTDSENYADDLLKEQIPMQVRELRAVMKFIDEQVEILKEKIKIDSKFSVTNKADTIKKDTGGLPQIKDLKYPRAVNENNILETRNVNNNNPYRLKSFFDDRMIFQQLDKLAENKRLNFINSTLAAINQFFKNKDFFDLPIHIRLLVRQLEGQKLIYENLEKTDSKENIREQPTFDFDFEKIKEYANELVDEEKYKYYARLQVETKRLINSLMNSEFKNFDGNKYFGLKEFKDSVNHILEKERCPELTQVVKKEISNLNPDAGEKEFGAALMGIEIQLMKEENRLKKVMEFVGYEIEYLEKILRKRIDTGTETVKQQIIEKITGKDFIQRGDNAQNAIMKTTSDFSNELTNAHSIMIKQRNKIKTLEKGITKVDLIGMIEKNKCRKKNGTINYSSLAKILGCSNHTAKSKCKFYGIA